MASLLPIPGQDVPLTDAQSFVPAKPWYDWLLRVQRTIAGTWVTFTPTLAPQTGSFTTVAATGRYYQLGKLVFVNFGITITTNGTAAGYIDVSVPVAPNAILGHVGCGKNQLDSTSLNVKVVSTANFRVRKYDGTYPGVDGALLECSITYEAA